MLTLNGTWPTGCRKIQPLIKGLGGIWLTQKIVLADL